MQLTSFSLQAMKGLDKISGYQLRHVSIANRLFDTVLEKISSNLVATKLEGHLTKGCLVLAL
jgi:hypothetical protein